MHLAEVLNPCGEFCETDTSRKITKMQFFMLFLNPALYAWGNSLQIQQIPVLKNCFDQFSHQSTGSR